jgi:hypothetical protein
MRHKVAEKVRAVPSVESSACGYDRVVACCIRVAASFDGSMKLLVPLFKIGRVGTLTYLKKRAALVQVPFYLGIREGPCPVHSFVRFSSA